ncbi:MAG: ribulose-phosphate 3-epimerase [Candidatus Izemoplasmatales bacterium]|jgi:ribulose-phosphate 3-epimerase|nr:ribulose-phosphate 3-epimerase [Candidatus Izemoplasmatales bacterium]MDD4595112.1 ribulose-phosphate 3-epimerase [Candidatus Izemoplasmatales bacterium]
MIIAPSFLTADFADLDSEINSIQFAKWLHFDVMDGRFVPKYTYNEEIVKRIKRISSQFFDIHLMIETPEKAIVGYASAGADLITFHLEATNNNTDNLIKLVKSLNVQCGISIKPKTSVENLVPYLAALDLVLIMSVEPGQGGQKYISESTNKIQFLAKYRRIHKLNYKIEVDGGINLETAKIVREAGADIIVVGSYIFGRKDRKAAIKELENA